MKRLSYLIILLLLAGFIGCGEESTGPTGPRPAAPTGLTAEPITDSEIQIEWVDQSSGASSFIAERSVDGGEGWSTVAELQAGTARYTDTELTEGTEYRYRVKAVHEGSTSDPSNVAIARTLPKAPTDLTVTHITSSQADLTWTDQSTVEDGFELQRKMSDEGESEYRTIANLPADTTSHQDDWLTAGNSYHYRIRAKLGELRSDWSNQTLVTTLTPPAGLTATSLSDSSIQLGWVDNSTDEEGYLVERSDDGVDWTEIADLPADIDSYTDSGLEEGTVYRYRLKVYFSYGESDPSDAVEASTLPKAPSSLTALQDEETVTQINLSWVDESGTETGYQLQRKFGEQYVTITSNIPAEATEYQDVGLDLSTTYYYRLCARLNELSSVWSNVAGASTTTRTPVEPSDLEAAATSSSEVSLSWVDNSDNEDGFKIQRSLERHIRYATIDTVPANQTSFVDQELDDRMTYYYRVLAFNGYGNSPYSNVAEVTTLEGPPVAPTDLAAQATLYSQIRVTWTDASDNETGFTLERSLTPGEGWETIATLEADTQRYTDQGLTPLTTYYYRIHAYNFFGNSPYSNIAEATTFLAPPNAPSNLTGRPLSHQEVELNWVDNADDETGFNVVRREPPAYVWTHIALLDADDTTLVDQLIEPDTRYAYRVNAFNDAGASDWSNEVLVIVPDAPPLAPWDLFAEVIDLVNVAVSWRPGSFNEDMFILERRVQGEAEFSVIAEVNRGFYSYEDERLDPETWYAYRVVAVNLAGTSDYSNVDSAQTESLVVIDDDFEEYEVGEPPGGAWEYDYQDSSYAWVTDEEAHGGDKSVHFHDPDTSNGPYARLWYHHNDNTVTVGNFELWLKLSPNGYFGIFAGTPSNQYAWSLQFRDDSTLWVWDGGGLADAGFKWTANEWFHVEIAFDTDARSYDVAFDDEVVGEGFALPTGGKISQLIILTYNDVLMEDAWLDDVYLEHVIPEEELIGPMRSKPTSAPMWFIPGGPPTVSIR